jgi:hypothetical protein
MMDVGEELKNARASLIVASQRIDAGTSTNAIRDVLAALNHLTNCVEVIPEKSKQPTTRAPST